MKENEVFATLNVGNEKFEARQDNTAIYRHLGKWALYDHVFVELNEKSGVYIWNTNQFYEDLALLAVEHECTLHLNIQEPSEVDIKAYIKHHTGDKDALPEWLPEV